MHAIGVAHHNAHVFHPEFFRTQQAVARAHLVAELAVQLVQAPWQLLERRELVRSEVCDCFLRRRAQAELCPAPISELQTSTNKQSTAEGQALIHAC